MYHKASFPAGLEEREFTRTATAFRLSLCALSQNLAAAPSGKCQLNRHIKMQELKGTAAKGNNIQGVWTNPSRQLSPAQPLAHTPGVIRERTESVEVKKLEG